jgi:hypothetical protein
VDRRPAAFDHVQRLTTVEHLHHFTRSFGFIVYFSGQLSVHKCVGTLCQFSKYFYKFNFKF